MVPHQIEPKHYVSCHKNQVWAPYISIFFSKQYTVDEEVEIIPIRFGDGINILGH